MANDDQQAPEKPARGSLLGRLLIAAFMGAVVISECLFAYFWLPSAEEVAAEAKLIALQAQTEAQAEQEKQKEETTLTVEVDLGAFEVTTHRLDSGGTFRADFHLWGTVSEEDLEEFTALFERNTNRFRNLVIEEIRASKVENLEDAGLGLIKRPILAKSNALLGKPLLRSVLFADYTFVEL